MKLFAVQFHPSPNPNNVASAAITLEDADGQMLTINDIRILRTSEGNYWMGMPMFRIRQSNGSYVHQRTVELSHRMYTELQQEVLKHFEKWRVAADIASAYETAFGVADIGLGYGVAKEVIGGLRGQCKW